VTAKAIAVDPPCSCIPDNSPKSPSGRRIFQVSVGYAWDPACRGRARPDRRWNRLRDELRRFADQAEKRASVVADGKLRGVRIDRLRATSGNTVWQSIKSRIEAADLLVLDITPRRGKSTQPNLLLELGCALAVKPADKIIIVSSRAEGHKLLPSDLQGFFVFQCCGKREDEGLRAKIVGAIVKSLRNYRQDHSVVSD